MEKITNCPVCNAFDFSPFLTCTDHTVSKKEFNIVQCKSCGFKFTNPRPDASELGAYYKAEEYISHTDTKQGLMNRLYHLVRKYTLIKKLQLILKLSSGSGQKELKILDIGCGTGAFLDVCKKAGMNSIGIEPDSQARQLAIEKYGLDVRDENAFLTLENDSFDVITLWHVLEHVPLLNEILIKIKELVKPNGRVVIAVPNSSSIDAKYYGKFWAAYDVPRHLYHFNPNDISALCKKQELKVINVLPMRFDSFYVSMLSEKYKTGKVNYIKAILIGLRSNISAIKSGKTFSSQIYIIKK